MSTGRERVLEPAAATLAATLPASGRRVARRPGRAASVPARHASVTAYAFVPCWTDSRVMVIDAAAGTVVAPIGVTGDPCDVAITPDGRYAFVARRAVHRVTVIDLGAYTRVATIPVGLEPHRIAISADGSRVYVTEARSHSMTAIDVASHATTSFYAGRVPWGFALAADGSAAYVTDRASDLLTAIDLATKRAAAIHVGREPVEVVLSANGRTAYVACALDNALVPVALGTREAQPAVPVGRFPRGLAIDPAGRTIVVANSHSDSVSLIDTATHAVIGTIDLGRGTIPTHVAFTPDGARLLAGTHAGRVHIIDVVTRRPIAVVDGAGQSLRLTVGPSVVVPSRVSESPLAFGGDEDLDALGFGRFLTFNGGLLRATRDCHTVRRVSLLAPGGIIDTANFHVTLTGGVVNDGSLVKRGHGTLTVQGVATHPSTRVDGGTLRIAGVHRGCIVLTRTGTLAGTGTVGDIDAAVGSLSPGSSGLPGTLRAANVTMGPGLDVIINLERVADVVDSDRLIVDGVAALRGARLVIRSRSRVPRGRQFAIVTNAAGTFAGRREGNVIAAADSRFHLTYRGGRGGRDVVLTAL